MNAKVTIPNFAPSSVSRVARAFTLLATLFLAGSCGVEPSVRQDVAPRETAKPVVIDAEKSHRQMIERIAALRLEESVRNPFMGELQLRIARQRAGAQNERTPLRHRWMAARQIGLAQLRLGEIDEAIASYQSAYDLLPSLGSELGRGEIYQTVYELGMAHLRDAETTNCVNCQTGDSCILPIREKGVHVKPEASRRAMKCFEKCLDLMPGQSGALWLLNIVHMTLGTYPDALQADRRIPASRFESPRPFPRFENVAEKIGLADAPTLMGSVAIDDFDGDGDLDVVTSSWDLAKDLQFFRNDGHGKFVDESLTAGLKGIAGGLNLMQVDYDNDGDLDIFVTRGAWLSEWGCQPNSLLRNRGDGSFEDVSYAVGLAGEDYPTQTADWADYDLDGDLDLYVGNEANSRLSYPSQLFRNRGNGTFEEVAAEAGVQNFSSAKGVTWGDVDGDRYPDLYVSNLSAENRLYRNRGDGTFEDVAARLGVVGPISSFPTWFFDFDNDGDLDLYASGYWPYVDQVAASHAGQTPPKAVRQALYRNDGPEGMNNVAREMGLTQVTAPMGANFGDLDNDGYPDIYLGTGYPKLDALMPNLMYRNRDGRAFDDVSYAGGLSHLQKGHGISFADIDEDGDQDVFAQLGGAFPVDGFANALFRNPGFGHHALFVELRGKESNRFGIGARICAHVRTEQGEKRRIYAFVDTGGSFGANPTRTQIGLGKATTVEKLEVFWPVTGKTQVFSSIKADRIVRIVEGDSKVQSRELRRHTKD